MRERRRRSEGRLGGIRFWATITAAVAAATALAIGSFVLVAVTRSQLVGGIETTAAARAGDIAQLAVAGALPDRLPATRGVSVQVIDSSGRVLVSTDDIDGQHPITTLQPPAGEAVVLRLPNLDGDSGDGDDDEGPFAASVLGVDAPAGYRTVVAAAPLSSAEEAASTLVSLLWIGIPLLAAVVAVVTWALTGRTLAPVAAMADEADRISLTDLQRRIPVPGSRDEIRHLADTLNRMLERLDLESARQRRFVADASHELKSPVASLLTMAEVTAANPGRADVASFVSDVMAEARRLARLVDDLLSLARSDEGAFALDVGSFDLSELVREEIAASEYGRERGVEFDLSGIHVAILEGDRRRIGQVIRNVADNAARHARHTVWIETRVVGPAVRMVVADDGRGIPSEERDRVFERFVRLDESRSRSDGGTGLGLAVARTIVEAHGGTIAVADDSAYSGAVVHIDLPTAPGGGPVEGSGEP